MKITKAGHAYLATRYEQAVDAGLDVAAIHRHLLHLGIARTPREVVHDLEHVYQFYGYAASHPAPPPPDVAAADRAIDQMTTKQLNEHIRSFEPPRVVTKRVYVRALARQKAAE